MKKIKICNVCREYTLKEHHCSMKTLCAHPPIFNPNDRYGVYRRKEKKMED